MTAAPASAYPVSASKLGSAWVAHCLALGLHTADEALTGFLSVYNPTVWAVRPKGWWFPPTFDFRVWLTGLILLVVLLLAFSPLFYRNVPRIRPVGYFFALINISNALGHMIASVLGHTVATVRFPRPAPGFYSSPFVLAASIYLLWELRSTRHSRI